MWKWQHDLKNDSGGFLFWSHVCYHSKSGSLFYSIETGLKLKELQTQEVEGNSIITENFYSNYEDVDGILFPMSINLVTPSIPIPGGLNLSAKSIKLNVDVSDSDFE